MSSSIKLLVIQPTPFCNINCDYCYLANRSSTRKMSAACAAEVIDRIASSGRVRDTLNVVWHAGEPLTMPVAYYEEVFSRASEQNYPFCIRHSFQTNGILINDSWCKLFHKWKVNVGVSIDGPAFIHDAHRKDRAGKGTHSRVLAGIQNLQSRLVPFHAIAVVTSTSLEHPNAIFDFFLQLGVSRLAFNIEEQEGANSESTVSAATSAKIRQFFERLALRVEESHHSIHIREFDNAINAIMHFDVSAENLQNDQNSPLAIITVAWDGSFTTFSPELVDARDSQGRNFVFGNILTDSLSELGKNPKFIEIACAIEEGRKRCARSCEYYSVCGGGAPSNKYFENKSFSTTETMYCRSVIQIPTEIMLDRLDKQLDTHRVDWIRSI